MAAKRQAVFSFAEAATFAASTQLLGGKGAGLARMVALGLPVPPGFTIHSGVSRAFLNEGLPPKRLAFHVGQGIQLLEQQTGRGFGNTDNPLLVSVRSGAAVSMPGMLDTVLNVGLSPQALPALAEWGGKRFAYDTYRRFLALFGEIVLGVDKEYFEITFESAKLDAGVQADTELSADVLEQVCNNMRALILSETGKPVPDDPREQLDLAIHAVFRSWRSERAVAYRQQAGVSDDLGTAVNIQAMVFGNHDDFSATGVVFSANVTTGAPGLFGEFLVCAQGEDVVSGVRTPQPIEQMEAWQPELFGELSAYVRRLAEIQDDIVDVEFTIESGKLYILQVRAAKRTRTAQIAQLMHSVRAGRRTQEEVLKAVSLEELRAFVTTQFDPAYAIDAGRLIGRGVPVSQGAVSGVAALSSDEACRLAATGVKVILVREDTSPHDLPGMLAASAIVTGRGGATCHAAIVAREIGLPAVVGVDRLWQVERGEVISVDGQTGHVIAGEVPLAVSTPPREVITLLRWHRRHNRYIPRLDFEVLQGPRLSANVMLTDFYVVDAMLLAAKGSSFEPELRQLRETIHRRTAEAFATYLFVAVAAELRHFSTIDAYGRSAGPEALTAIKVIREELKVPQGSDRWQAQECAIAALSGEGSKIHAEYLRLAAVAFDSTGFGYNYGGPRWAAIAHEAWQLLTGQHAPSVFVDHVFDLRHNTGRLFDKHSVFTTQTEESRLLHQLDSKKKSQSLAALANDLFLYARPHKQCATRGSTGCSLAFGKMFPVTTAAKRRHLVPGYGRFSTSSEGDYRRPFVNSVATSYRYHSPHVGGPVRVGHHQVGLAGTMYMEPGSLRGFDLIVPLTDDASLAPFRSHILYLPLIDMGGVPDNWEQIVIELITLIEAGKKLAFYCAGGHGRTGVMLASLIALMESEEETPDPLRAARRRHCLKAVETPAQAAAIFSLRGQEVPELHRGSNLCVPDTTRRSRFGPGGRPGS